MTEACDRRLARRQAVLSQKLSDGGERSLLLTQFFNQVLRREKLVKLRWTFRGERLNGFLQLAGIEGVHSGFAAWLTVDWVGYRKVGLAESVRSAWYGGRLDSRLTLWSEEMGHR